MNDQNDVYNTKLPRLLIIGQTFTNNTGGGITLSNLLKEWPKEKIAVAIESKEPPDFQKAGHYYRLGYQELKMPFPFSILQRKTRSGPIQPSQAVGAVTVKETAGIKFQLKNFLDKILHSTGLFYWMYGNQKISSDLLKWIAKFKPDVIYYQPNALKSIPFAIALKKHFQIPLISHVMDDWFSFAVRPGLFKDYWNKQLDQEVRALFAISDQHLSICNYMSIEYQTRYGYEFTPFHNCVDLTFWDNAALSKKTNLGYFNILYAGRLGYGVESIIQKIADTIERMGNKGIKIRLEIQTKDQKHELATKLQRYQFVKISDPIKYDELPAKFNAADALLIPSDFSGEGLEFIKYSMPTKVSEYMATGTPVWVVAPPGTALAEYAVEGWAHVCLENTNSAIEASILKLMSSKYDREKIIQKAEETVKANHDKRIIVPQFEGMVNGILENFNNSVLSS